MVETALKIDEQHADNVCILMVAGRIDSSNAAQLIDRLTGVFAGGARAVLLDLARVLYLTSAGFRAMIIAIDEAEQRNAEFALCAMSGDVRELFEMGGLLDLFRVYGTREEALSGLR